MRFASGSYSSVESRRKRVELTGRGVLITGGKRIGAAIAVELARRGADVALSYNRSEREARAAARTIAGAGRRAFVIKADLSAAAECQRLVDEAATELGRLDVLINMASVYSSVPLDQTDEAIWDAVIDIDLKAAFLCARAAVPHLRAAGGGRIVNFADWVAASRRPRYTGYLPYYVAKSGVIGESGKMSDVTLMTGPICWNLEVRSVCWA